MLTDEDRTVHVVPTLALMFANDDKAGGDEYWLWFREAGEELYSREYTDVIDLPQNIDKIWRTPRFEHMQRVYAKTWPRNSTTAEGAFNVIRQYQRMKTLRQYSCLPIELLTSGDAAQASGNDYHTIEIAGVTTRYARLDGNHRLMSAFFTGLAQVPVRLRAEAAHP